MKHLQLDPNGNPMPVFFPGTKTANATIKVNGTSASAATQTQSMQPKIRSFGFSRMPIAISPLIRLLLPQWATSR